MNKTFRLDMVTAFMNLSTVWSLHKSRARAVSQNSRIGEGGGPWASALSEVLLALIAHGRAKDVLFVNVW